MKYLVDTSKVVDYLRQEGNVVGRLQALNRDGLAVSIITVAELFEGVYRAADQPEAETGVQEFLAEVSVLPINLEVSRVFGRERARLRSRGTPISDLDLLIASTAIVHHLTLLTGDRAFERLESLTVMFA